MSCDPRFFHPMHDAVHHGGSGQRERVGLVHSKEGGVLGARGGDCVAQPAHDSFAEALDGKGRCWMSTDMCYRPPTEWFLTDSREAPGRGPWGWAGGCAEMPPGCTFRSRGGMLGTTRGLSATRVRVRYNAGPGGVPSPAFWCTSWAPEPSPQEHTKSTVQGCGEGRVPVRLH